MTRRSRHSAGILLPAAEEDPSGPRRGVAPPVTQSAFPPLGQQQGRAMHHALTTHTDGVVWMRSRHSMIAICTAHVLNAVRAPTASFTSKLTRHERGANGGSGR